TANLLVMVVIFARLTPLVTQFQQGGQSVARMLPVFDHINELRRRCIAAAEPLGDTAGQVKVRREIRLSGVGFRYDKDRATGALDSVNLVIPACSTMAIVGATGAGKSTLADLLLGPITPDVATVLIDGAPLCGALLAS